MLLEELFEALEHGPRAAPGTLGLGAHLLQVPRCLLALLFLVIIQKQHRESAHNTSPPRAAHAHCREQNLDLASPHPQRKLVGGAVLQVVRLVHDQIVIGRQHTVLDA